MSAPSLPSSALWEVIHSLTHKEVRALYAEIKGTRLGWLFKTLRQMAIYSDEALQQAFQATFPNTDSGTLRTYKKQLWFLLEKHLPPTEEALKEEIHVWQRLWLSVVLWRRGLTHLSRILWHQAIEKATRMGWYEVALWGLSLLELYDRELHTFPQYQKVEAWANQLLALLAERYHALTAKIAALEAVFVSRPKTGPALPPLPDHDSWGAYMNFYTQAIHHRASSPTNLAESLSFYIRMAHLLTYNTPLPTPYVELHRAFSFLNIGVMCLNCRLFWAYEHWHAIWERIHSRWSISTAQQSKLSAFPPYLYLAYLLGTTQWHFARLYAQKHFSMFQAFIFSPNEYEERQAHLACLLYLVFLLDPQDSYQAIVWHTKVHPWIEERFPKSIFFTWWLFLRWYQAFRTSNRKTMRYWYRKLRGCIPTAPPAHTAWKAFLRILWGITELAPYFWPPRIRTFLKRWEKFPEEKVYWYRNIYTFPVEAFLHSLLKKVPLETISVPPPEPIEVPPETLTFLHETLHAIAQKYGIE
ncbi:MAG: hypothetical protein N3A68_00820 [Bacteroidia bacterium]|jgi:hypothetical protein|nr:hypothetical protein [Bacteroidia bacterium]GIV23584.1 MAG: hypothetical protein KatS3mg025_1243 [Bacteroidia bacterium]